MQKSTGIVTEKSLDQIKGEILSFNDGLKVKCLQDEEKRYQTVLIGLIKGKTKQAVKQAALKARELKVLKLK